MSRYKVLKEMCNTFGAHFNKLPAYGTTKRAFIKACFLVMHAGYFTCVITSINETKKTTRTATTTTTITTNIVPQCVEN